MNYHVTFSITREVEAESWQEAIEKAAPIVDKVLLNSEAPTNEMKADYYTELCSYCSEIHDSEEHLCDEAQADGFDNEFETRNMFHEDDFDEEFKDFINKE